MEITMASNMNQQFQEFEETITCPVCLARFDETEKKPKYLVSCCHTVCRSCLERISRCGTLKRISCPICRRPTDCTSGIDSLPTNGDKLYLLKLEKPLQREDDSLNWCFTCRKSTSLNCSAERHSVVIMNPQLLNSDIQLNVANISARLQAYSQSIVQNRLHIGAKLNHISEWLASFHEMIERFKTSNSNRICQLNDIAQGTDITISMQKLMQLSISKDNDLELLTDSIQEESLTKKLLEEIETVEKTADLSATGRFSAFLDLPSVPRLFKELDYANFFTTGQVFAQWPIVMIESLAAFTQNPLIQTKNSVGLSATQRAHSSSETSPAESRFVFPRNHNEVSNLRPVDSSANNRLQLEATAPIFRFEANNTVGTGFISTPSPSLTGTREFLCARRRRR